jgi:hypothetical protein
VAHPQIPQGPIKLNQGKSNQIKPNQTKSTFFFLRDDPSKPQDHGKPHLHSNNRNKLLTPAASGNGLNIWASAAEPERGEFHPGEQETRGGLEITQ